jgi:hypothetical protein
MLDDTQRNRAHGCGRDGSTLSRTLHGKPSDSSSRVDRSRPLRQVEPKEEAHDSPLASVALFRATRMILAGSEVRNANVQLLADMLDGELAAKLERGIANNNKIVALTLEDRHRIVEALDAAPYGLVELRSVLIAQLKKQKERALQEERSRLSLAMVRRREELG